MCSLTSVQEAEFQLTKDEFYQWSDKGAKRVEIMKDSVYIVMDHRSKARKEVSMKDSKKLGWRSSEGILKKSL